VTTAALFAGAAYDPSASGTALAWQRPGGVALLSRGADAVGLPGRNPALAPGRVAWCDGGRIVVADAATLTPAATYDAPGTTVLAVSEEWLAWRVRDEDGTDRLYARPLEGRGAPVAVAAARPPAELGRPALAGGLLLFHAAGPRGNRLAALDLATGRTRTLRRERGAMLSNPATDGASLLYVRASGLTQELRLGALRPADPAADRVLLVAPSPGVRDTGFERGREPHDASPLPPRSRPGVADTLWSTALTATDAYVTRLRTSARAPRTADILRVPVRAAAR
jgi:hypothetical protein